MGFYYFTKLCTHDMDPATNCDDGVTGLEQKLDSLADFDWISQLRYYWHDEERDTSCGTGRGIFCHMCQCIYPYVRGIALWHWAGSILSTQYFIIYYDNFL